jgi:hypothetical protein
MKWFESSSEIISYVKLLKYGKDQMQIEKHGPNDRTLDQNSQSCDVDSTATYLLEVFGGNAEPHCISVSLCAKRPTLTSTTVCLPLGFASVPLWHI